MALFEEKNIVTKDLFYNIYWEGFGKVMTKRFNSSFATFYSKHMIRCCGVRHHLHYIDPSIPDECPCCGSPGETTAHIALCPDKDRTTLYHRSVSDLIEWMTAVETSPVLARMIGQYLTARNSRTMSEILLEVEHDPIETQVLLAEDHDKLGWQNFIEGRISKLYLEVQQTHYRSIENCRRSAATWAQTLIEKLIKIIHNQWTWRNEKLHFRRYPGAETAFEYEQTMERIMNQLEMTDPEDLLPEDQYLLEVDPEDLAKA